MNYINSFIKKGLAHPFLLIIYFIVYGINMFHPEGKEWMELSLFLSSLLLALMPLLFLINLVFKNKINGRIWLTIALFFTLFFAPLHITFRYLLPTLFPRDWYSFLFLSLLLVAIGVVLFVRKKELTTLNQYLTLVLTAFILMETGQFIVSRFSIRNNETQILTNNQSKKYNIYLIIPDGYASADNLKKYWHFDNSAFINYLKNKGFFIAHNSRSNYRLTDISVSSMLDLNYKPHVENAQWVNVRSIERNLLSKTLKENGYYQRLDIFDRTQIVTGQPIHYLPLYHSYFLQTAIYKFYIWFMGYDPTDNEQRETDKTATCKRFINELKKDTTQPQFVYIHPMFTHIPFSDTLSELDNLEDMREENKQIKFKNDSFSVTDNLKKLGVKDDDLLFGQYLFQIKRTNKWLINTLDNYWSKLDKNSIVIIMSDHGSRFLPGNSPEAKEEFYQNFEAIYFPDKDYSTLNDTITPINVMRMSVNKAMGSHLLYLPDKSY